MLKTYKSPLNMSFFILHALNPQKKEKWLKIPPLVEGKAPFATSPLPLNSLLDIILETDSSLFLLLILCIYFLCLYNCDTKYRIFIP